MKTAISIPDELFRAADRAAKRLGLSKALVTYMVNTGKLAAVRATVRGRQVWKIDVSSATCSEQHAMFDQMSNDSLKEE